MNKKILISGMMIALCGATLSTYPLSRIFGKGKANIGDIANASLASGVGIGFVVRLTGNKKDAYEEGTEFENPASE